MTIEEKTIKNIYIAGSRTKEIEILKSKGVPLVIVGDEQELAHGVKVRDLQFEVDSNGNTVELESKTTQQELKNKDFNLGETANKTNIMNS